MENEINIKLLETIDIKIIYYKKSLNVKVYTNIKMNVEECYFVINYLIENYLKDKKEIIIETYDYNIDFSYFSDSIFVSEDCYDSIYLYFDDLNLLKQKLEKYRNEKLLENF